MHSKSVRNSTSQLYHRSLKHFASFVQERGISPVLPSSPAVIYCFVSHIIEDLGLSTSTLDTRVAAIQFWYRRQALHFELAGLPGLDNPLHSPAVRDLLKSVRRTHGRPAKGRRPLTKEEFRGLYARGFNLSTPSGLHQRLALLLLNLGCLRRNAAAHLRVVYELERDGSIYFGPESNIAVLYDTERCQYYIELRVDVDKNVREGDQVFAYIPEEIPGLQLHPVRILLDYLRRVQPPSGGYLLAAPRSKQFPPTSFHSTLYSSFSSAFKNAHKRAWPSAAPSTRARISSHSGRKSLAQWLWDAYRSTRLIADVGHWKCQSDAVHLYFVSSRAVILDALSQL